MKDEKRTYERKLAITKFALEEPNTWKYVQDEIQTDEGAEQIYKDVLKEVATSDGLTEDELLAKYAITVEEHYMGRNHIDYIDINEDTYYLYDSLNRLAVGECDKVEVWAYGKEPRYEVRDDGEKYEVEDKSLMLSAEAIEAPISLMEFVHKKAPIKVTTVAKEEPKTISLAELGRLAKQKPEQVTEEGNKDELDEKMPDLGVAESDDMEDKDEPLSESGTEAMETEAFEWQSEVLDEKIKEAYKEGYMSGFKKGLAEGYKKGLLG